MSDNETVIVSIENRDELVSLYQSQFPSIPLRTIVLLSGEVGVGKTESVRIFSELWNLEMVSSPSYSVINEYRLRSASDLSSGAVAEGPCLYHVDLYRLKDDDDLESTGFWDLFTHHLAVVVLEWADRIEREFLPLDWQQVKIHIAKSNEGLKSETSRVVTLSWGV